MSRGLFGLTPFLVLFALSSHAGAPSPAQVTAACQELGNCWNSTFEQIDRLTRQTVLALESPLADFKKYKGSRQAKMRQILSLDVNATPEKAEEAKLNLLLATLKGYLDECRSLGEFYRDPRQQVDLILMGKAYDVDGNAFTQAAEFHQRQLKCSPESRTCSKGLVITLRAPGRQGLEEFLRLLPPLSIRSLTYVGHGLKDQIIVGEKHLSRPPLPNEKLKREDWVRLNDGSIYIEDLLQARGIGDLLFERLRAGALVRLFACDTGQEFAGVLARMTAEEVWASDRGMHFNRLTGELVPDFGSRFFKSTPTTRYPVPPTRADNRGRKDPETESLNGILTRVALGSSPLGEIQTGPASKKTYLFSPEERAALREILGTRLNADTKTLVKEYSSPGEFWVEFNDKLQSTSLQARYSNLNLPKMGERVLTILQESRKYY